MPDQIQQKTCILLVMKIAIDCGPLTDANSIRGVGAYTKHLVTSLQNLSKRKSFTIDAIDAKSSNLSQYDVIHYPFFDFFKNTLPIHKNVKTVVTIHDTIPLLYPLQYPPGLKGSIQLFRQKRALKSVSHVITISETSKKDIVRYLPIDANKITSIYEGPTIVERDIAQKEIIQLKEKYGLPEKFILYIGDVNWNKNILTLCKAAEMTKIPVVIIGSAAVQTNFDRNHIENRSLVELQDRYGKSPYVIRLGYVADDLAAFFKAAFCYCQPSFYEGFGLSVLDALLSKTPVVCAKTQALTEIYEEACTYFDPKNVQSLVLAIESITNHIDTKENIVAGYKLAKSLSWEKTAEQTYEVYKKIISN